MRKLKFIILSVFVFLLLFVGITSKAASNPEDMVSPLTIYPTGGSTTYLVDVSTSISDGTSFYCEPFQCSVNYAYVQVNISSIRGNSLWFTLQRYDGFKWLPEDQVNSKNTIFVNDDLKSDIYLMFCGSDKTNYVTPNGVETKKVLSVSTSLYPNAVLKNEIYRIVIHNKAQWNGKTAYVNATMQVKNL